MAALRVSLPIKSSIVEIGNFRPEGSIQCHSGAFVLEELELFQVTFCIDFKGELYVKKNTEIPYCLVPIKFGSFESRYFYGFSYFVAVLW